MSGGGKSKSIVFAAALLVLLVSRTDQVGAHVTKESGPFEVELGWGEEPPRSGGQNFVEVAVSGADGAPVAVPAGALSVEVVYDDAAVTLPLVPTAAAGTLEAQLTPTRPGTYSFDVSGSIEGKSLDVRATCSESTFECVETSAGPEFPVKDPSAGELALKLSSEAKRVEDARDQADGARTLAIVALALAAVALATSIPATRRRRGG